MNSDHRDTRRTKVRRKDREVTEQRWISDFLHNASAGVLGTSSADQPFLTSNLFVFDPTNHAIYLHSAKRGRTRANVERNPRVCFTAFEMGRLLPADVALQFSVEYASVVVFGDASLVESKEEAQRAMQMLLDKYFPHLEQGKHYRPITDNELHQTSVFKISIKEWSGKRKSERPDYPGAFLFPS